MVRIEIKAPPWPRASMLELMIERHREIGLLLDRGDFASALGPVEFLAALTKVAVLSAEREAHPLSVECPE